MSAAGLQLLARDQRERERTQTEMFGLAGGFLPGHGGSGEVWEEILFENLKQWFSSSVVGI